MLIHLQTPEEPEKTLNFNSNSGIYTEVIFTYLLCDLIFNYPLISDSLKAYLNTPAHSVNLLIYLTRLLIYYGCKEVKKYKIIKTFTQNPVHQLSAESQEKASTTINAQLSKKFIKRRYLNHKFHKAENKHT